MTKPRFSTTSAFVVAVVAAAVAGSGCAPAGGGGSGGSPGSGGGSASGGGPAAGTGGISATGGAPATGGAASTGGTAPPDGSGGAPSTGGSAASGGAAGGRSGGSGGASSGGASGMGGGGGAAAPIAIPRAGRCAAPAGAKVADAQAAYDKWKKDLLTSDGAGGFLRVRRPNSSGAQVNSTVSEGIAYGMLAAVLMNDQPTFDKLWQYSQLWLDSNGLMDWYINAEGTQRLGTGAATDSDEDMAFALLLAAKKWGGQGSLAQTYMAYATKQIDLIWRFEVDHTRNDVLTPGDKFGGGAVINISYFAPAFYRAFGRATGQTANWNRVVESTYTVLAKTLTAANGNASNGLVPAWSTPDGVPQPPSGSPDMPIHHQLDSCRTPFRLAQDYCWNGEARALTYLQKINGFHATVGATNIVDGYDLNGTAHPQFASVGNQSAAFVGPAAVGAMATAAMTASHAMLRDQGYAAIAPVTLLAGSQYYNESWTVLSLIMMTGLFDDTTL